MSRQVLGLHTTAVRASGPVRPLLVIFATAPVAALALVGVAVTHLPRTVEEIASNLLSDPGVRAGYIFGLALTCLAPLALLYQAVRLGSASRERRLAALRVSGVTPGEVRLLGALDVAAPAVVGAALGVPLYLALRGALGGITRNDQQISGGLPREFRVIPSSVEPSWWEVVIVVALIGAAGALIGALALGSVVSEPLGTSRQISRRPPRPWSLLLLVPAAGCVGLIVIDNSLSTFAGSAALLLIALALLGLGPSAAHLIGRWAQPRASSGPGVLAAARLVADPRATGRAAATVSVISLASGISAWFLSELQRGNNGSDAIYVAPLVLVLVVLVVALVLVSVSLAVHGAETATDRKRATAALSAQGAGSDVVVAAHRRETELTVLPLATLGVVLGSVPAVILGGGWGLVIATTFIIATVGLAWLAVLAATALARPAITRACSLDNLRNG